MGFRALRVINDDVIAAGKGFGPHAHRDMEILTYVTEGRIRHRDSMGQERTLGPNEIQLMSAGSGVVHSEFNGSETDSVHLFQIWIFPAVEDLQPSYQQIAFSAADKRGQLCLLTAPENDPGYAKTVIHQDARVYVAELAVDDVVVYSLKPRRHAWVQIVKGSVSLSGHLLDEGDGVAVSDERDISVTGTKAGGEVLLFDLP